MKLSADFINPFLLALIFAFIFSPTIGWLQRKGLPSGLALLLTILAILVGAVLFLLFVGASFVQLQSELSTYQSNAEDQSADLQQSLSDMGIDASSVFQAFDPAKLFDVFGSVLAKVINVGAALVTMFLLLIFMLFETLGLPKKLSLPSISASGFIQRFRKYGSDIRRYVLVLTWINLLVGLGDTIFLYIVGVPYPVLWGLLAWFMGYIPSVGFWLALIPPVLLAYAEYGATTALIVFLGYVLINGGVQNLVQPKLMGDAMNLSPLVVIASLFVWVWVLGPLGALIAVPMTMAVHQLVLGGSEGSNWLADLMGALPPDKKDEESAETAVGSE